MIDLYFYIFERFDNTSSCEKVVSNVRQKSRRHRYSNRTTVYRVIFCVGEMVR